MEYLANWGIIALTFMISAQSYNLILGYTGMFHMGHIAFVAIGAYGMSILLTMGVGFWLALPVSMAITAVAGLLLGLPALKLREDYLVIATLGFGLIVHKVAENWVSLTGGPYGITQIPRPSFFGGEIAGTIGFFGFVLVAVLLIQGFVFRLVKSAYGKKMEAIREDEIAARAIGINVYKCKMQVLVLGAVFAGIAGALNAQYYTIVTPKSYMLIEMVYILIMVMLGGAGNFWGAILGSLVVNLSIELFRFMPFPDHMVGGLRVMFFAATLIVLMIWRPNGLLGKKVIGRKY